jgi:predicted nucleic acid-binding protein
MRTGAGGKPFGIEWRIADQAKLSFWDALVVVAAARAGATVLYTEDMNDGQEVLGVRISNPFAA